MSDLSGFSMWELFRGEAASQMQALASALLSVEAGGDAKEALQAAMRAAHSLKGAARIVQLDLAVELAHDMEDLLVAAQEGKVVLAAEAFDLLLACADMLSGVTKVEEADADGWAQRESAAAAQLRERLQACRAGRGAPAAEAKPEAASSAAMREESGDAAKPEGESPAPAAAAELALKVASESLNRIMSLAGEGLVAGRRLETHSQALLLACRREQELSELLLCLEEALKRKGESETLLEAVLQKHGALRTQLSRLQSDLEGFALGSQATSEHLYHEIVATRMRPIGDLLAGFPRIVRDLARRLGKQVRLEMVGAQTLVDREIQERLEAPLNHIVRNCLDHGVEPSAARLAAGKPETAQLRMEARHLAGQFVLTISDDGRGVDTGKLRAKLADEGRAPRELIDNFSEEELLEFLLLPGFSTAGEVTELSGRGVGLDAVQTMVKSVGGSLRMSSRTGLGLTTTIALPLTLSVLRTLVVEIAGEPYALPLTHIDKAVQLEAHELLSHEGRSYILLSEERIGVVAASAVLGKEPFAGASECLSVVVLGEGELRIGMAVDRFVGEQDLVVRPLDRRLGMIQDVSVAALLEDGSPVLILDTGDLLLSMQTLLKGGRLRAFERGEASSQSRKRILVVEDSITVRELERSLLSAEGYEVEVAVDGQDGWNALRTGQYDLLMTDVDMPRISGLELVERVRADARLQRLPVIIVSYKDREEDRARGLEAGADRYLTKNSFQEQSWKLAVSELLGAAE